MAFKFSEEDIKEFKSAFELFDKNKDSFITLDELKGVMESMGNKPTDQEIDKMIEEIDADGDKKINFSEFLNLMAASFKKRQNASTLSELQNTFKIFDKNNDGFITHTEMKTALDEMGEHMSDYEVEEMIRAADTNGDGMVDYNEFLNMMTKK